MFHTSIFGTTRGFALGFRLAWLGLVVGSVALLAVWVCWPDTQQDDIEGRGPGRSLGVVPGHDVTWIEEGHAFLRLQSEWETRLQQKANRAVAAAFGENAYVSVNLELDPRSDTRTGVNLPPGGLPPNVVETTAARRDQEESIPSDPSVAPAEETTAAPASATFVSKLRTKPEGTTERKETDPSLYGTRTERLAAPAIRRLRASIVVDRNWLEQSGDREAVELALLNVVRCAVGFNAARGDRIDEPAVVPLENGSPYFAAAFLPGWGTATALLIAALLGVALLVLMWQRRASEGAAAAVEPAESRDLTPDELAAQMRERIERAIEADAEAVSRTLGEWAMEQRS